MSEPVDFGSGPFLDFLEEFKQQDAEMDRDFASVENVVRARDESIENIDSWLAQLGSLASGIRTVEQPSPAPTAPASKERATNGQKTKPVNGPRLSSETKVDEPKPTDRPVTSKSPGEPTVEEASTPMVQDQQQANRIDDITHCLVCGAPAVPDDRFCRQCGSQRCGSCCNFVREARFCTQCGQPLTT